MRFAKPLLLTFGLLLLTPVLALAELDGTLNNITIVTYNGFYPVLTAFQTIAHIFKSNDFNGIVISVCAFGIAMGAMAHYLQAFMGGRGGLAAWLVPTLAGVVVYTAFFAKTSNVVVRDDTLNRVQVVADVPRGAAIVAGGLNWIEEGMVEILDTAIGPAAGQGYIEGAGGLGLTTLMSFISNSGSVGDPMLGESLVSYVADCVSFEITRPGTTLSMFDLTDNVSFIPALDKAMNMAVFTTYYDAANPEGRSVTCNQSWTDIKLALAAAGTYNGAIDSACSQAGFNTTNAVERASCNTLLANTAQSLIGVAVTPNQLMQQAYVARTTFNTLRSGGIGNSIMMEGEKSITQQGVGALVTLNEYLPLAKGIITAVAIGLIPFIALFIPTPLSGRALQFIFGFFLWITAWGVTDAVVHQFAMAQAMTAFKPVATHQLGIEAILNFPTTAMKTLSLFGIVRTSAITLATAITMILVKFGGHAMANVAGGLAGSIATPGKAAGALASPEARAAAMKNSIGAASTMAWANSNNFNEMAGSMFMKTQTATSGEQAKYDAFRSLKANGTIPQDMSYKGWVSAQNSAGSFTGSDGLKNFAVAPATDGGAGAVVMTSTLAGHSANQNSPDQTNPTRTHGTTSTGAFSVGLSDAVTAKQDSLYRDIAGQTQTAGTNYSAAVQSTSNSRVALQNAARKGAETGDTTATSLDRKLTAAATREQKLADKIEEQTGFDTESSRKAASMLTTAMETGMSWKSEGTMLGWVAEKLAGTSAGVTLKGGGTLRAEDASQVRERLQAMDSSTMTEARGIADSRTAAYTEASGSYSKDSQSETAQAVREHGETLATSQQAASTYSNSMQLQRSVEDRMATSSQNGVTSQEKLDPALFAAISTHFGGGSDGDRQASNLIAAASAGDPIAGTQVRAIRDDFVDQYAAGILNGEIGQAAQDGRSATTDAVNTEFAPAADAAMKDPTSTHSAAVQDLPQNYNAEGGGSQGVLNLLNQSGSSPASATPTNSVGPATSENFEQHKAEVQAPTQRYLDAGKQQIEGTAGEIKADVAETKDNTTKVTAIGGLLLNEGQGVWNAAGRGTDMVSDALGYWGNVGGEVAGQAGDAITDGVNSAGNAVVDGAKAIGNGVVDGLRTGTQAVAPVLEAGTQAVAPPLESGARTYANYVEPRMDQVGEQLEEKMTRDFKGPGSNDSSGQ